MPGLILVRHAMPEVVQGVSSKLWRLTESAREDCVLLAHALPAGIAPIIGSSEEPKAQETAAVIALRRGYEVVSDPGFGEVDRPEIWDRDYREVAANYLAGTTEPDWEPQESVVARFGAAAERLRNRQPDGDLVVATHGLAMSLFLASIAEVDIVPFWRSLTFPDAWRVDTKGRTLRRIGRLPASLP